MKNDIIHLVVITTSQDADGFPITAERAYKVFADVQSAKRTEYYQAQSVGINAQLVAVVNYADYVQSFVGKKKPSQVIFDDVYYDIKRTYRKGKENDIELTLAEVE